VKTVLSDASLWDADLSVIPGLTEKLSGLLLAIGQEGMKKAMMINQESNNSNI
jgi:hypothetical protein